MCSHYTDERKSRERRGLQFREHELVGALVQGDAGKVPPQSSSGALCSTAAAAANDAPRINACPAVKAHATPFPGKLQAYTVLRRVDVKLKVNRLLTSVNKGKKMLTF